MTEATISVSVLNITVCVVIIIGCVYAMYQLIKKYQSVKQIKNPQGEIIGSKKTYYSLCWIYWYNAYI